jgi:hypothetical protein
LESSPNGQVLVNGYGDVDVLWIENGNKFLDVEDVRSVLGNIKVLSAGWRSFVDPKGGALRFYIDQC